jgi:hypothetical protein
MGQHPHKLGPLSGTGGPRDAHAAPLATDTSGLEQTLALAVTVGVLVLFATGSTPWFFVAAGVVLAIAVALVLAESGKSQRRADDVEQAVALLRRLRQNGVDVRLLIDVAEIDSRL